MPPSLRVPARTLALLLSVLLAACDAGPRPPASAATTPPAPAWELTDGVCRVIAPDEADARAGLRACARATTGLSELLDALAPPGVVCLTPAPCEPRPAEVWVASLPPDSTRGEPRQLGGGETLSQHGYLAHEIAHRVATAMIFPHPLPGADTLGSSLYGSPLPDWLDEALAMLVEPEPDRHARLRLLFQEGIIHVLPLRRLLYMPHPALAGIPPGAQLRRTFYGQSLAVAIFVRERARPDGLRRLIDALRSGTTQGRALTDLPGLPGDGGELEQAWLRWLRAQREVLQGGS